MKSKICTKCGELKELKDYYLDSRAKDEHTSSCKSCRAIKDKNYVTKNIERVKDRNHKYYVAHSDKVKETSKGWQQKNPERTKEIAKKSHYKHPETQKRADRKWRQSHPEKHAEFQRNRRARVRGSGGTISRKEFQDLCALYDYRCLKCGRNGRVDVELTIDHVIPIKFGGPNTIDNAQPLCRGCNSSKKTKSTDYRFGLSED